MGKFRDGMPVTGDAVSLILATIDRIKEILDELEQTESRARRRRRRSDRRARAHGRAEQAAREAAPQPQPAAPMTDGSLVPQTLERPLRPGEVSLDELERAFRETAVEMPVAGRSRRSRGTPLPAPRAEPAAQAARARADAAVKTDRGRAARAAKVANQSIRVKVETLEHLMTMVSELVLTRNQLLEIVRRHEDTEFKVPLQRLSNVTAELQEGVMKTRMQPIGNAWQKLPRIVRDLVERTRQADRARDARRRHRTRPPGARTDQGSADAHGAQLGRPRPRDARPSAAPPASPRQGTIRLSAYHEGGQIIIEIADDGRGLNTERIKQKAIANGLATEAELEKMTEAQIHKFIFAPGFSTAAEGHQRLRPRRRHGRGEHQHRPDRRHDRRASRSPGEGTSFTIKIPLTLAIVSALIVEAAGDRFAIPQLVGGRTGARARQLRAPHRAHQGHAGPAPARQAAAADRI